MKTPENAKRATKEMVFTNRLGFHAKPAGAWLGVVRRFNSELIVETADGEKIDGRRIFGIQMSVIAGQPFKVHAVGEDAEELLEALSDLVRRKFDEE